MSACLAGCASGPLGAYLVRHGRAPAGALLLEQGYEMGRPSLIELTLKIADGKLTGASIGGSAVVVMEGTIEA